MTLDWDGWLLSELPALRSGCERIAPRELPHPSLAGFRRVLVAEPWGQKVDWVRPNGDGSRAHVHEFRGDVWVVHLDRRDPARGPGSMLGHWLGESASGRAAMFTSVLWVVLRMAVRA